MDNEASINFWKIKMRGFTTVVIKSLEVMLLINWLSFFCGFGTLPIALYVASLNPGFSFTSFRGAPFELVFAMRNFTDSPLFQNLNIYCGIGPRSGSRWAACDILT